MLDINYQDFLDKVFANSDSAGISTDDFEIDHIAYRTESLERYNELKGKFCQEAELLDETIIRDRPIAIFRFDELLKYKHYVIPYFELMAPAVNDKYKEGLEHTEFVVPDLSALWKRYPEANFIFKDRKINPELVLIFPNNINLKFHTRDIGEVVRLQKETGEL